MKKHSHSPKATVLIALILTAMMQACTTPASLMSSDDTLAPGEGVLILRIHSVYHSTSLHLKSIEGDGPSVTETPEFDGLQTLFIRLPSGKYSIETIFAGGSRLRMNSPATFRVREGVLGYGGDLYLAPQEKAGVAPIFWRDEQSSIESYLRAKAPEVYKRYEIDYALIEN